MSAKFESGTTSEDEKNMGSQVADPHQEDKDIDGGYGWVVVFAAFLILISSWGLNSAYGVYFAYYVDSDRYPGARPLDYAAIGGISIGVGMFCAPIVNYIQGLVGARSTICIGALLQFSGGILASFSTKLWQLYLTQGLLTSFGLAFTSLPALTIVPQWFVKRRVLANLFVVTGSGVGGVIFNLGLQKIIEVKNVEWALRAQSIIATGLLFIAVILIRTRHEHHKVEFTLYDHDCASNFGFWVVCLYLVFTMFGYVVVMYSLADFAISLGLTSNQGAVVSAMLQVSFCFGRPLAGFLADSLGPITVTVVSYFLATIFTLAIWIPCRNYATLIAFALLQGMCMGTVFPTCAPIIARIVGIAKLNIAFSMLWMFFAAAALFSNIIGNALTSGTGSGQYRNTAIFAGCSFFGASLFMIVLRGYVASRDLLAEVQEFEITKGSNVLQIQVPLANIYKNCYLWPKKRI